MCTDLHNITRTAAFLTFGDALQISIRIDVIAHGSVIFHAADCSTGTVRSPIEPVREIRVPGTSFRRCVPDGTARRLAASINGYSARRDGIVFAQRRILNFIRNFRLACTRRAWNISVVRH